jgi:phosphopantothenoylcysteine decarboxylase/phosphopantothenate--cysteine ligase
MGAALAKSALRLGADVTVVSGPAKTPLPSGARVIRVVTAAEMRQAMQREFKAADICIMAAAVGDFRPVMVSASKIARVEGRPIAIEFEANPDILAELGAHKGKRFLVGFALETDDGASKSTSSGVARAKRKMAKKGCDMMVLNRADESLSLDSTRITIIGKNGAGKASAFAGKDEAADFLMQRIAAERGVTHEQ